jgi:hypothetical protein
MTDEELQWLRAQFERCSHWLQDALDRDIGAFELDDVWNYIATGKAQLWPLKNSAIVTALEYFPRKTVLRYWLCGGELEECVAATPAIEAWGKSAGATIALIGGRRGWLRVLPGFEENSVFMTKAL